ncbi:AraC family transcriptional regulator [Alkalicoccobacillus murimartini]|uniref:AraC-like DNA-binding protein n=1 Tax=Alkalicoccobacillus murimartini TaxID=171685 RepID=A0ABT9YEU3_9BACI|nr:AraC family transcriptional regulator [Alkalicoccobacillus murimartini]MDQ0206246.1 AraC-like DNA-binding protein [Alkalicoccobacillus murimartini]
MLEKSAMMNQMYEFDFNQLNHKPSVLLTNLGWETRSETSYDYHGLKRSHSHGFLIFQYTLSGVGCLEYEGTHYRLKAGDAFFVSVPSNHRYYVPEDEEPWEFVFLTLGGEEAERIWRDIVSVKGPVTSIGINEPIIKLLMSIIQETMSDRLDDPFQASLHGYQFLLTCMKHFLCYTEPDTEPHSYKQAIRYMEENYHQSMSLDDIAEQVFLSRYALIRLFKKYAETTPIQYLNNLRIQQACKLLIHTNKPIKNIAVDVGYANANYFNKAFRKAMGLSVGRYRESGRYT